MVRYCAVRGCRSKSLTSTNPTVSDTSYLQQLSFHHIPNDPIVAKKWLIAMDNPRYPPNLHPDKVKSVVICSKHFEFDQYRHVGPSSLLHRSRKVLNKGGKASGNML